MALTREQIQQVQTSFEQVEPIADQAAVIFYDKLFEYDPALRALFKGDMHEQGRMLMSTLKLAVRGLSDLDSLVPVLQKLAARHVDYGVKAADYTPVGNALLYTLKTGLGEHWNDSLREAWLEVYRTMAQVMKAHAH
ncbi:globin family protein [Atopomonas sediminilitoris]|uniref:globin family protein n=1 Tax=Atopomonas sediminilitoris TaxID=2919919 RepID=UPI001F4E5489|nr:globin family protein [Atopomonas sediminilitoris]MCJ8169398.1 globin domain-containing protein [Atopomonas sediminilitoris]